MIEEIVEGTVSRLRGMNGTAGAIDMIAEVRETAVTAAGEIIEVGDS